MIVAESEEYADKWRIVDNNTTIADNIESAELAGIILQEYATQA